jgi:hypothetical protein
MTAIDFDGRNWTSRRSRNSFVAMGFLAIATFLSLFPIAVVLGSQSDRCPDERGWQIAAIVVGAMALFWVGFLLKHAIGTRRAGVRVSGDGITVRNIASKQEFRLDEVEGFAVSAGEFSYYDEIFFSSLFFNFITALRLGMASNTNVEGVKLKLVDGREILIWSLMDNTDDTNFAWRKQRHDYDWPAVAADLNRQLDDARAGRVS